MVDGWLILHASRVSIAIFCMQDPSAQDIASPSELAVVISRAVQVATGGSEAAGLAVAKEVFKHLYEGFSR